MLRAAPLIFLLPLAVPAGAQDTVPEIFPDDVGGSGPMSDGNGWPPGCDRALEREITWHVEVVDVVERGPVQAIFLRGHPDDLIWFKEGRTRGDYAIVQVEGDGLWHVVPWRFGGASPIPPTRWSACSGRARSFWTFHSGSTVERAVPTRSPVRAGLQDEDRGNPSLPGRNDNDPRRTPSALRESLDGF